MDGGKTWLAVGGNLEETMSGLSGGGPSVAWVKVVCMWVKSMVLCAGTSNRTFSTDRLNAAQQHAGVREGANLSVWQMCV